MPNTLGKNLNLCLSLIKQRPRPQITLAPHHPLHNQQHYNNYNSLYEEDFKLPLPPPMITTTTSYVSAPASPSSVSTDYMETEDITTEMGPSTPDLTAAYASRRFFISSPGRSNSIVDSLSLSSSNLLLSPPAEEEAAEVAGGVPVQTYSPDPYVDFRRSMQEMVEARDLGNLEMKEAWDYLQELLLTYLALNPKNTHKYIVGAFTDLVLNLMSPINHTHNHSINHNTNHNPSTSSSSSSFSSSSGNGGGYVLS